MYIFSHCFLIIVSVVGRVFANGQEDLGSVPGRVIPKTLKMVLDTSLLNNQQYKVRIESKSGAIQGKGVMLSLILRCSSYWKGAFWSPSTTVANFIYRRKERGRSMFDSYIIGKIGFLPIFCKTEISIMNYSLPTPDFRGIKHQPGIHLPAKERKAKFSIRIDKGCIKYFKYKNK